MCDTLKAEFKLSKFKFSCSKPEALYQCQWKWHPAVYLTLRIVMAAYALGALITCCVMSVGDYHIILVYLTIWTFILLTLHLCISAALACFYRPTIKNSKSRIHGIENPDFQMDATNSFQLDVTNNVTQTKDKSKSTPEASKPISWFLKMSWLLGNVVLVFEIIVTVIYFVFLFPNMENRGYLLNDLNMHAVNTAFVFLDFWISARPVHQLHCIHPAIYGIIYATFSVIYWTQDHVNNVIYSVLDWNSPGFAIGLIAILAIVIIPMLQLVFFGLFQLRLRIYTKLYNESYFKEYT